MPGVNIFLVMYTEYLCILCGFNTIFVASGCIFCILHRKTLVLLYETYSDGVYTIFFVKERRSKTKETHRAPCLRDAAAERVPCLWDSTTKKRTPPFPYGIDDVLLLSFQKLYQLQEHYLGVVALARSQLEDPCVSAVSVFIFWRNLVKELGHNALIEDKSKSLSSCVKVSALCQSDQFFCFSSGFLSSAVGGLDPALSEQIGNKISEHGLPMS